jgi:hypothetical protein
MQQHDYPTSPSHGASPVCTLFSPRDHHPANHARTANLLSHHLIRNTLNLVRQLAQRLVPLIGPLVASSTQPVTHTSGADSQSIKDQDTVDLVNVSLNTLVQD